MTGPDHPPVRLCCGTRHWGVQCPDGLVQCCICWNRVKPDYLVVVDGVRQNVCLDCEGDI